LAEREGIGVWQYQDCPYKELRFLLQDAYGLFKKFSGKHYLTESLTSIALLGFELLNWLQTIQDDQPKPLTAWVDDILRPIFIRKNHDYGNSFERTMDEFGPVVAKIRIGDKVNRFLFLSRNAESEVDIRVLDESLSDTLLDLCNYCILSLMWLDKQKD
jgi:hypothetical protein